MAKRKKGLKHNLIIPEIDRAIQSLDYALFESVNEEEGKFIVEYLKTLNATKACLNMGYPPNIAKQTGSRYLNNERVKVVLEIAKKHIAKFMGATVENSVRDTKALRDAAWGAKQFMAAAKLQEHLDAVTGVYNPKVTVDLNLKGSFNVMVPSFKPPSYAEKEVLDVGPAKVDIPEAKEMILEKINGSDKEE